MAEAPLPQFTSSRASRTDRLYGVTGYFKMNLEHVKMPIFATGCKGSLLWVSVGIMNVHVWKYLSLTIRSSDVT